MIYLTLDELMHIGRRTLGEMVVRDEGLLHAALSRPSATYAGTDVYPNLEEKAAALVHSLVRNHALVDGNKRLALSAVVVFLKANGRSTTWTNDDAYEFIMDIAAGRENDISAVACRIAKGTVLEVRRFPRSSS